MLDGLSPASPQRSYSRFRLLLAVTLTFLLASGPVIAQSGKRNPSNPQITSSLPPQTATPEQHRLEAGPIEANVTVLRSPRPFPAGGSAFATLELSSSGKARLAGTEVRFDPVSAKIVNVIGNNLTVNEDGSSRIAKVTGKLKRQKLKLVVELALGTTATDVPNSLKVTLRNPEGGEATTTLDWSVVDCASGFYSEIVKVRNGRGGTIEQSLAAARTKGPERTGRWLFQPITASARRGKCLKSVRRWSSRRGRYVYVCTSFEKIASANAVASVPYERRVYNFASRLVRWRARDNELQPGRDSGWATSRVSQNLKGFLAQKKHPALCTGTLQFFDYFDARMQGFLKRAKTYDDMRSKSHALALLRTVEASDATQASDGGHPGWGNSPLLPGPLTEDTSLKKLVQRLATLTGDVTLAENVTEAGSAYGALKVIADYMKSEEAKSLETATRTALKRALGAVEAADYIEAVADQYDGLRNALAGSMQTLRRAHTEKCTCSG